MAPLTQGNPQPDHPERRPGQGVRRQVNQVRVNRPHMVKGVEETHHVFTQHQSQPALAIGGRAIQARQREGQHVHGPGNDQGQQQPPVEMAFPALFAQQMRQQHQPWQDKTDQPLEQRGQGQQQEKHTVAAQTGVIGAAPVPPDGRQQAEHGKDVRRGHPRPEYKVEGRGQHPASDQPGTLAKQLLADQVHQPYAQPGGKH